jgi:hypothetical protein
MRKWLTDLYEGKIKWKPKSQPIPTTQVASIPRYG